MRSPPVLPLVVVLLLVSGCQPISVLGVDRSVRRGLLDPKATLEDVPVSGTTVRVETEAGNYKGELISVDEQFLWVVPEAGGEASVPRQQVKRVSVEVIPSTFGRNAGWTLLGMFSSVSHGVYGFFSAPLWLLVGGANTLGSATTTSITLGPEDLDLLWQYARFPQGRPQDFQPPPPSEPSQPAQP